jgi:hypothetical protein
VPDVAGAAIREFEFKLAKCSDMPEVAGLTIREFEFELSACSSRLGGTADDLSSDYEDHPTIRSFSTASLVAARRRVCPAV